ncbi:hypothetical protein WA577_006217, partial [Blastocystis sp. JDR]
MSTVDRTPLELSSRDYLELKLSSGLASSEKIQVTNTSSEYQVVKIKSNAGKHIGVSPSVFYIAPGEVRELSVTIKPANVDALIIERSTMNKDAKGFKLQFNTLEISAIFYDKLRTVSERDFLDIVNKRWNMSEKGKIKQSILPVYLVYSAASPTAMPSSSTLTPIDESEDGNSFSKAAYYAMQDQLKKLTLSNNKGKELLENLEKKYAAVKKQLEVFKSDIASAEENKEARVAKVRGEIQSLYSGITLFQLLFCIVVAFVAGLLFMKFFS